MGDGKGRPRLADIEKEREAMDRTISFRDVIGPTMVGPSSSHTAGACRIGNLARSVYSKTAQELIIDLHGSFAETYQGHGTDRAIVGGILGYQTDDPRIIHALDEANRLGLKISYRRMDLGPVHPNTARINFLEDGLIVCSVTGSSIGGGQVRIVEVDGVDTYLDGKAWSIIMTYKDRPKMIFDLTSRVAEYNLNIASMSVTRKEDQATLIAEFDDGICESLQRAMENIKGLHSFRLIPQII